MVHYQTLDERLAMNWCWDTRIGRFGAVRFLNWTWVENRELACLGFCSAQPIWAFSQAPPAGGWVAALG